MKSIAIVGDKVILPKIDNTEAVIISGSSHKCNGKEIAVVGSVFEYYCPKHKTKETGTIITGGNSKSDSKSVARDGDLGTYCEGNDGYIVCSNSHKSD